MRQGQLAVEVYESTVRAFGMTEGFVISAKMIHALFGVRQPFPLWASRNIVRRCLCKEFRDYIRDGKDFMMTTDTANVVAISSSAYYQVLTAKRMTQFVNEPGNEHLRDFRNLMAEAIRRSEEGERLEKMIG